MEAWLIYYKDGAEYNRNYIQMYLEEGVKLGIHIRLILAEDLEFGIENNQLFLKYKSRILEKPNFAICRVIYPLLSTQLELMGIKVYNNSFVAEICNDKGKTYQYLAKTGIKMVNSSFYRNAQIEEVLFKMEPRTVIKAVEGHGGSQVFLIDKTTKDHSEQDNLNRDNKQDDLKLAKSEQVKSEQDKLEQVNLYDQNSIIDKLGSSDVVVQPFTGNRHQDLRVYVIGKAIIAAVLRTSKEGFRANFSLGGEVALYQLSENEREIITTIVNQFEFGLVGIDFIIGDEGELIFNEIEDVVGARMLFQCSDINIVEKYLNYIIRNLDSKPIII